MGQQVKRRIEMKNRHLAVKIISYVILSAGAVMMVLPFYWMIITAFKTPEQVTQMPPICWPPSFLRDNVKDVLRSGAVSYTHL